ncbi:uncharacterized protein LOC121706994 [Alosa sapidissima]|uniref:uncharacterized protein LOC121706994 n=1 Tax=Alosa sapidissima TaxID=34773 RepID=UPI001C09EB27|nr:uncharacterized protein LOC121706994 [Alosa sapidissima]
MEDKGNSETRSQAAQSAKHSNRSTVSLQAARARARAEAERARAHYAKKELEVRMEQVRMEGALIALKHEKEAAAAMAEAIVFQEAAESIGEGALSARQSLASAEDPIQRTKDFVEQHSNVTPPCDQSHTEGNLNHSVTPVAPNSHIDDTAELPQSTPHQHLPPPRSNIRRQHVTLMQTPEDVRSVHNPWANSLSEFKPLPQHLASPLPHPPLSGEEAMSDIARFLARLELIHAGLTKFDDRPENYWAWKSSFVNAKQGLYLTASEELDLLIKWLGHTSSESVNRIRSVHISYPDIGLKTSWDRLEEVYGAPEVIEKALLDRIESFPKITKQDPLKLRELGDLLREVLSAKTEGFLAGLSYLDTSRGVNPIIEKLPYPLQEKWINQGSQYKRKHNVSFPPFSFFTDFVCTEAQARNDPSFNFSSGMSQAKPDVGFKKQPQRKIAIAAHKTEVASTVESPPACSASDTPVDPGKHCLFHKNKPHPLKRCRGFRAKPLEERKAFLKDNGVCYRCCSSTTHLAKDCKAVVKCNECESVKHTTALHPGPPPWQRENAAGEHGGEENAQPVV